MKLGKVAGHMPTAMYVHSTTCAMLYSCIAGFTHEGLRRGGAGEGRGGKTVSRNGGRAGEGRREGGGSDGEGLGSGQAGGGGETRRRGEGGAHVAALRIRKWPLMAATR